MKKTVHPFAPERPDQEQREAIEVVRIMGQGLFDLYLLALPESRERSLAITALEEMRMWLDRAIIRHGPGELKDLFPDLTPRCPGCARRLAGRESPDEKGVCVDCTH